jgi:hypothetical protein
VQRILQHSTASVAHLNLETSLHSGLEHEDWGSLYETAKPAFNKIIGFKVFSRLESIVLRGFVFTLKDLETFLLAHAGTLREVHLINCCLSEASETELIDSIKSRLQPALALTGVEIYALVHADHCRLGSNPDIPIIPQRPGGSVVDPPVLRKELEALFMGGRPNAVTEIKQDLHDANSYTRWWSSWLGCDGGDESPPSLPFRAGSVESDIDYELPGYRANRAIRLVWGPTIHHSGYSNYGSEDDDLDSDERDFLDHSSSQEED